MVIADGDTHRKGSLQKEVIELYADVEYVNRKFNLNLAEMPDTKYQFFKHFSIKDDIVKNILSRWAKNHLTHDSEFVQEINNLV